MCSVGGHLASLKVDITLNPFESTNGVDMTPYFIPSSPMLRLSLMLGSRQTAGYHMNSFGCLHESGEVFTLSTVMSGAQLYLYS